MVLLICRIWNKKQTKLTETENRLVVARDRGWEKWVKGVKRYKPPSYKRSQSWGAMHTWWLLLTTHCAAYLKAAERAELASSHHKKKTCNWEVTDVNWIYCGDDFVICTNTESLPRTPETNPMPYVIYTSIKEKRMAFNTSGQCLLSNRQGKLRSQGWELTWNSHSDRGCSNTGLRKSGLMLVISSRKSVAKLKKCTSILGEYKEFRASKRSKVFDGSLVSWLQKFRIINLKGREERREGGLYVCPVGKASPPPPRAQRRTTTRKAVSTG